MHVTRARQFEVYLKIRFRTKHSNKKFGLTTVNCQSKYQVWGGKKAENFLHRNYFSAMLNYHSLRLEKYSELRKAILSWHTLQIA